MDLSLSKLTQAKCAMPALHSKLKYEKLAAPVRVLQNTQNLVFVRMACSCLIAMNIRSTKIEMTTRVKCLLLVYVFFDVCF